MKREQIIEKLNKVCDEFEVYQGLSEEPAKLTYNIVEEHPSTCIPGCFPQWDITFKYPHFWSNDTITYDTMTVNIHNFIEVDDIINFSEHISGHVVRKLLQLSSLLCTEFNKD